MQLFPSTFTRVAALASTGALVLSTGALLGSAQAASDDPAKSLKPRTFFTMEADGSTGLTTKGDKIPNVDAVKSTIRTYYNAKDGIADKTVSPYITEVKSILAAQESYLAEAYTSVTAAGKQPALVVDVDDTTLMTYDMEDAAMDFHFDPALQDVWVQGKKFPATPGMVAFVKKAQDLGYTVFGLTGRNSGQETATLANLTDVGYAGFTADTMFTKWKSPDPKPDYVTCAAASCTTVEYKAGTRKHIEADLKTADDKAYDIVLNIGDQWSDLMGGFADRTLKLPNPTYYLPSANLPGVNEPSLAPRTTFQMNPDGSSGAAVGGEGIPNIDSVKSTIRSYYNATDGVANKWKGTFVDEMKKKTKKIAPKLKSMCQKWSKRGKKPAVVFDVDDTLLWDYTLRDSVTHFADDADATFDQWVSDRRFRKVPAMPKLVRKAAKGGCKVVAITERTQDQKAKTRSNLNDQFDQRFKGKFVFAYPTSDASKPAYLTCAVATCTPEEFKSQTRKYLKEQAGMKILYNIGDQFSDLTGGYGERRIKLPNPTAYAS